MPVEGFPSYEVSDQGRVRNIKPHWKAERGPRLLKPSICTKGYRQVRLWRDGRHSQPMVHQLVMMAFNGPPPDDGRTYDVHHKNNRGYQSDSDVPDNLEWILHHEHWRKRWRAS